MRIANACSYPSKYYYSTALVLSFFTGFFGGDRFYLGYYALGILYMNFDHLMNVYEFYNSSFLLQVF